jgi:hypothetical protein
MESSLLVTQEGYLDPALLSEVEQKAADLFTAINNFNQAGRSNEEIETLAANFRCEIEAIHQLIILGRNPASLKPKQARELVKSVVNSLEESEEAEKNSYGILVGWAITHALGRVISEADYPARSRSWLDEYLFGKHLANALVGYGLDEASAWRSVGIVKILTNHQDWYDQFRGNNQLDFNIVSNWLKDGEIQRFLLVNRYQGILWFNHESFVKLLDWMMAVAMINELADPKGSLTEKGKSLSGLKDVLNRLKSAELKSEYQVEKLLEAVKG